MNALGERVRIVPKPLLQNKSATDPRLTQANAAPEGTTATEGGKKEEPKKETLQKPKPKEVTES